jgi:hypothetical protein
MEIKTALSQHFGFLAATWKYLMLSHTDFNTSCAKWKRWIFVWQDGTVVNSPAIDDDPNAALRKKGAVSSHSSRPRSGIRPP